MFRAAKESKLVAGCGDANSNTVMVPPKRALSAYLFFCSEHRPTLKEKHPDLAMGQIAKKLGEAWATLGEEARQPFYILAEKDKQRYQKEKATYVPLAVDSNDPKNQPKKTRAKRKAPKDPMAIKKPLTAYFHYLAAKREKVMTGIENIKEEESLKEAI